MILYPELHQNRPIPKLESIQSPSPTRERRFSLPNIDIIEKDEVITTYENGRLFGEQELLKSTGIHRRSYTSKAV